jgi:hypothetical protein
METIAELTVRRDAVQERINKLNGQTWKAYNDNRQADLSVLRMEATRLAVQRDELQVKINNLVVG